MDEDPDFNFEPIPGLPALPPKGELLLWQGRPDTWRLAVEAFGLLRVAGYFAAILLWRASVGFDLGGLPGAFADGLPYVMLAAVALAVIWLLAVAQARSTVCTVTTARVAMRIGAALSVTFNIPFAQVTSANADIRRGGTGTIALTTSPGTRLSCLICWPHVRPLHFVTQPALRCIPGAARVARIVADAAETRLTQPVVTRDTLSAVAAE